MRTIIVATAFQVEDDFHYTQKELDEVVKMEDPFTTVVGILDRERPENNYEPQIFAGYKDEQV